MDNVIACHGCDLLVDVGDLPDGGRASCPRCSHFLTRYHSDAPSRVLAYTIASILLLILSSSFPFLAFGAAGIESEITLWQTAGALWQYDMKVMAIMVAAFILVLPAVILLLLAALCVPLMYDKWAPWLGIASHGIVFVKTWVMVEVFIIGVIVSLVKIAAMATVTLGISFWAYAAFSVCFTLALVTYDRYQFWGKIEDLEPEV